jgi:hypothetical protein
MKGIPPFSTEALQVIAPIVSLIEPTSEATQETLANGYIRQCSWCQRVYDRQTRVWRYATNDERAAIKNCHRTSHGVCPLCQEKVKKED